MNKFNFKGFTLIELLVVITIIGILSSLLVVNYVGVRARSRDAQRKSDLRQIQAALEIYRSDNGKYPDNLPVCGKEFKSGENIYMKKFPCDPTNSDPLLYKYATAFSKSAYTLAACLENVNDNQKDSSNNPVRIDDDASITSCAIDKNWSYTLFSP